jgi:hypothetical protein
MKSCTFIGSVVVINYINKDNGANNPQGKFMPHWYVTCSNHYNMLVFMVIIMLCIVPYIVMMVKMTKQNDGDNGNNLIMLEWNDVVNKALFDNPYQATCDYRVVELHKELVRVGLAKVVETL